MKYEDFWKIVKASAPDVPDDDPMWAELERAIRAKFGGKYISIPGRSKEAAEKRNKGVLRDRENGIPVSVIMGKYGLSRAAVYKILKLKETELTQPKK